MHSSCIFNIMVLLIRKYSDNITTNVVHHWKLPRNLIQQQQLVVLRQFGHNTTSTATANENYLNIKVKIQQPLQT
eukprot:m.4257 g.4257  ORF g.4257 m.4257 type:complete len:75 (-) comp2943_c0_seq1:388-612(-)